MDREELRRRRMFRLNYQINKKYFKKGENTHYEKYHEKNIEILEEYEKNERT